MISLFKRKRKNTRREPLTGGWYQPENGQLTDETKAVFENAMAAYDGPALEPLRLLGTQVVAGINYRFLCRTKNETPEEREIVVYRNLQGQCRVLSEKKGTETK